MSLVSAVTKPLRTELEAADQVNKAMKIYLLEQQT